jgi:hypothetical protein
MYSSGDLSRHVSRQDLDTLFAHLVRSSDLLYEAMQANLDTCLNAATEPAHRFLYGELVDHFKQFRTLPALEHLYGALIREQERSNLDAQLTKGVADLLDLIYLKFNEKSLLAPLASRLIGDLVLERRVFTALFEAMESRSLSARRLAAITHDAVQAETGRATVVEPFSLPLEDLIGSPPRGLTGVEVIDMLMRGGPRVGELYGFLAPTGGGKTTLSSQLALARARAGEHVLYFIYEEEPNKEFLIPLLANATGISRERVEAMSAGNCTEREKEKIEEVRRLVGDRLHYVDMSGAVSSKVGSGGPAEVERYINEYRNRGMPPSLFIIDWFWIMATRHMKSYKVTEERTFMQTVVDELKQIARRNKCWGWVTHQIAPAASTKRSKMQWQDAAEFKSFAWFLTGCFAATEMDEDGICVINYSKSRNSRVKHLNARLNGELARFVVVDGQFIWDERQKKFVEKDKRSAVPSEDLQPDPDRKMRDDYSGKEGGMVDG